MLSVYLVPLSGSPPKRYDLRGHRKNTKPVTPTDGSEALERTKDVLIPFIEPVSSNMKGKPFLDLVNWRFLRSRGQDHTCILCAQHSSSSTIRRPDTPIEPYDHAPHTALGKTLIKWTSTNLHVYFHILGAMPTVLSPV